MKKYFVNYGITRQEEFLTARAVKKFLRGLGDLAGVRVEIGRLEDGAWYADGCVSGNDFLNAEAHRAAVADTVPPLVGNSGGGQ